MSRRYGFQAFLGLLMLLGICSCMLSPPYHRPPIEMPENWRLTADESTTIANLDWWEQFNDPVLNDLIEEALQNNRDLKVAIATVYNFLAQYEIVRSQLFPQIYGTGSYAREEIAVDATPLFPGFKRIFNEYMLFLNLSWQIDLWGQIRSETEAARQTLFSEIEARRAVVLMLVSSVASAYIQLRSYDKQLEVSRETLISFIYSFELAKFRFFGGLTSEMEVIQAESEVESALIQIKQLEISQQQQENMLCVLVGRNPGPIERGPTLDEITMPPDVPAGLPSEILDQRPDILQIEHQLMAANANIGAARALLFPQINLTGYYGTESLELRRLFTHPAQAWQYAVSFVQQIYDAGKIYNEIQSAITQKLEALYTYEQTILTALQEVDNALIALQKNRELIVVQTRQVKVLKEYLYLAKLRFDNGQTDYLNVLDAERNLFSAQLSYAQELGNCFLSVINLYAAVGGGWVLDADKRVNKCLDME